MALLNINDILETITMIQDENLDIRTNTICWTAATVTFIVPAAVSMIKSLPAPVIWSRSVRRSRRSTVFRSSTSVLPLHLSLCWLPLAAVILLSML